MTWGDKNTATRHRSSWGWVVVTLCLGAVHCGRSWFDRNCENRCLAAPLGSFDEDAMSCIAVDAPQTVLAPYVWKRSGAGVASRVEATMPGAYIRWSFGGSRSIRLLVDGTANNGCPAAAMPVVDYSVDGGVFQSVQLTKTEKVYAIVMAEGLDATTEHRLDVCFRAACLGPERWQASTVHLRIAGIELDQGGSLLDCPQRPKCAIGFGDSITEGVCNEGSCPYYSNLLMNNARATWFPLVCAGLNCEYGQLGTGGQGMVRPIEMPPLPQTWDHYDAATSRLTDGRLLPEPDYVFCAMGTNDFRSTAGRREQIDITEAYADWLAAVRKACPRSLCFCVVPPLGWHGPEIAAAVAARHQAGDDRVYLIDTAPLQESSTRRVARNSPPTVSIRRCSATRCWPLSSRWKCRRLSTTRRTSQHT